MQRKGFSPCDPVHSVSSKSNFSDRFLDLMSPFLHFHLNPAPHPFGKQLISDWFSLSETAIHSAVISSLTPRHSSLGSTAVLRDFLKQLLVAAVNHKLSQTSPDQSSTLWVYAEN